MHERIGEPKLHALPTTSRIAMDLIDCTLSHIPSFTATSSTKPWMRRKNFSRGNSSRFLGTLGLDLAALEVDFDLFAIPHVSFPCVSHIASRRFEFLNPLWWKLLCTSYLEHRKARHLFNTHDFSCESLFPRKLR